MSDNPKNLAKTAGTQAKHAAQNSGRAVEAAAGEAMRKTTPTALKVVRGANVTLGLSMASAGISYAILAWQASRGRTNE